MISWVSTFDIRPHAKGNESTAKSDVAKLILSNRCKSIKTVVEVI